MKTSHNQGQFALCELSDRSPGTLSMTFSIICSYSSLPNWMTLHLRIDRIPHTHRLTHAHVQSVRKLPNSHRTEIMLEPNKAALWSLQPDTANYKYNFSILSVRGNRGINLGASPLLPLPSRDADYVYWLISFSCFDHNVITSHIRDNKTISQLYQRAWIKT